MDQKNFFGLFLKNEKLQGKLGNVFFENGYLYSYGYHFPLARIRGGRVFVNVKKYSPSTSKQQSYLRAALRARPDLHVTETDTDELNRMIYAEGRAGPPMD